MSSYSSISSLSATLASAPLQAALAASLALLVALIYLLPCLFSASPPCPPLQSSAPPPLAPHFDADVVIIGAGTAGAALATVLARDGKRVVMIERCVVVMAAK